jgi:hypothetical protein
LRPTTEWASPVLKAMADDLAAIPGMRRVAMRPNTQSLLLEFDGPPEPVLAAIAEQGIAQVRMPDPPPPISQTAKFSMLMADMSVKQRTGGILDLNGTIVLLLVFAAVIQLTRGRVAGPATSLLMAALAVLERSNPR